jgi:hypothetical protein
MKECLTKQSRGIPRRRSQIEIKFEGNWSWGLVQERAKGGKEKGRILQCPEGIVLLNYVSWWKLSSVRVRYTADTNVPECDETHNPDLREKIYLPLYSKLTPN